MKKPEQDQPFSQPGARRNFAHSDGRTYALQVLDCRVVESWSSPEKKGGSNTSTRKDDAAAQAFANAKMRGLLKKGFVETMPTKGIAFNRTADVVDTMRSDVDYKGETRYDFRPVSERRFVYTYRNVSVEEWLLTTADRRSAIRIRCKLHGSTLQEGDQRQLAGQLLDELEDRRTEIFDDLTTALRSFPLRRGALGRFTRLVVLSPTTENATISRDVSIANHELGRSVFRAFPAFDCETTGSESVAIAEARCSGPGAIPSSSWDRLPHPVFDLAYLANPTDVPQFFVHDPTEIDARLGARALLRMREAEVHVRNYAGQIRRIARGDPAPDVGGLRAFLTGPERGAQ